MNRIYSLAALVLIGGSLSAQRLNTAPLHAFNKLQPATFEAHPGGHPLDLQSGQRDIVFTEDFANGLAGNNGDVGAWTISGANGNVWRYSFTGPVGAYSNPTAQIIASPSVANGFMIFNSDSANSIFGTDTTIVASPVELVGSLVSPAIDLSTTPAVQLKFSERFRYCCSTSTDGGHFVDISTDDFATWTRVNVENGVLDNTDSGTLLYAVNLTGAITANPANVRFRFTQDGSVNGITHYNWQIDDISIESLPANDLKVLSAATTTWDFNTANSFDSVYYTMFPVTELRPLALNMTYYNNGSSDGTNVQANISVDDGYNQTTAPVTFAPGDTGTAMAGHNGLADYTPTTTVGDHNITFTVTGDATDNSPADNVATAKIAVTDYIYARDENSRDGGYDDNNDPGSAFKLGNKFYCNVDETAYGIDVAFSIVSAVDVELNAQILDPATEEPLYETGYSTVTSADLSPLGGNKMLHFFFDTPVQLSAGTDYLVVVQHFGGLDVLIGTSGTSQAQTSNFYRQSNDTWYYVTNTPMVRLNFNPTIGIAESDFQNGVGMGQNYPNPANTGSTRIDVSLQQSAHVNLVLRDIGGKLVQTLEDSNMAPGVHHVDVNTANLGAGVYFYTLTTNNMVSTKRMTVVR